MSSKAAVKPRKRTPTRRSRRSRNSRLTASTGRSDSRRARTNMSMTQLQFMAKSMGIPFGGLPIGKLINKINNYQY